MEELRKDVANFTAMRKAARTDPDVQSNKAQRLESVASRVPTLQALAWRKIPADEYASLPEPVRDSVYQRTYPPPPVETSKRDEGRIHTFRGPGHLLYKYEGANDYVELHADGNWYTTGPWTYHPSGRQTMHSTHWGYDA